MSDDKPTEPEPATPQLESILASDLEELRASAGKAAGYLDLAKRTQADFVNYQSRVKREREEYVRFAAEGLLRELLPVIDDLQRLLATPPGTGAPALLEGVTLIERELSRVLAKAGVRPIETDGKKFDPTYHEAGEMVDPPAGKSAGDVVGEDRRGYLLHDRVLRPARVKVARAAASA
jgi:molecular chaperone GrpE